MYQLLTQGSADIVLDACSDFWDGEDLCELLDDDRKTALNFFQRMNITGHCIAFSYRPVIEDPTCKMPEEDFFIEFPPAAEFSSLPDSEPGSTWSLSKLEENNALYKPIRNAPEHSAGDCRLEDIMRKRQPSILAREDDHAEDVGKILGKQIFIGMVALQDLVKDDVSSFVEGLNNGGIRFVYFSYENELRSRVFSEKLGLEAGWNCHISLADPGMRSHAEQLTPTEGGSETDLLLTDKEQQSLAAVNDDEKRNTVYGSQSGNEDAEEQSEVEDYENYKDVFFISNRAKLPRGIRNIRPHLEKVDDVPLLVPLFTDCTPQAIADMIEIMQEYGEVVCCMGSSLNSWNNQIFVQADVSVSIEPLHPQLCLRNKSDNYRTGSPPVDDNKGYFSERRKLRPSRGITPFILSSMLNGVSCSLQCHRNDKIKFISIICEARRIMFGMRSCCIFLLLSYLSLSFAMILSFCALLPFPLTGLQLLWLTVIILPLLSVSLVGTPADSDLMNRMTGKRLDKMKDVSKQFFKQYAPTFGLNAAFIVFAIFAWNLYSFCHRKHGEKGDCHLFLGARNLTDPWHGWSTVNKEGLFVSQDLVLFFTSIYFVALSVSFVHRTHPIWKKSPFRNKPWFTFAVMCLILQFIHTTISIPISHDASAQHQFPLSFIPWPMIIAAILWPVVLIALSELMKKRYIKMYIRYQKRERLKFDTKLGMNSPV